MRVPTIVPLGASLSVAIGIGLFTTPAKAATVKLNYDTQVSGSVTINPEMNTFLSSLNIPFSVPTGTNPYSKAYSGQVQITDALQTDAANGDFGLGFPSLAALLQLPAPVVAQASALLSFLTINFDGVGTIFSTTGGNTPIQFFYDNTVDQLIVKGYQQPVLEKCLVEMCEFKTTQDAIFSVLANNLTNPLIQGNLGFNAKSAPAMPTPAMLPGVIGMGISAWRRRRTKTAAPA